MEEVETGEDMQITERDQQDEKLAVPLISADEVKNKGPYVKKAPFNKYEEAVGNTDLVDWIKQKIKESRDGVIRIKFDDVVRELGPAFENRLPSSIYMGLNYILCKRGLILNTGTTWNNEKIFIIRYIKEGDVLPKYVRDLMIKEENYEKIYKAKENVRKVKLEEIKKEKEEKRMQKETFRKGKQDLLEQLRKEEESKNIEIKSEKITVMKETVELRKALRGIDEKKTYMIEVYEFNWNTLSWKLIKGRSIKSDSDLLKVIKDNTSKHDTRIRLEITAVADIRDEIRSDISTDDITIVSTNAKNAEKDAEEPVRIEDAVGAFFNVLDKHGKQDDQEGKQDDQEGKQDDQDKQGKQDDQDKQGKQDDQDKQGKQDDQDKQGKQDDQDKQGKQDE